MIDLTRSATPRTWGFTSPLSLPLSPRRPSDYWLANGGWIGMFNLLPCNAITSNSHLRLDGGLEPPHCYVTKEEMDHALKYYTGLDVSPARITAVNTLPAKAPARDCPAVDALAPRLSEPHPTPSCTTLA